MLSILSPQLYLGIDAGSTHTEAVYADGSGFVLGRSVIQQSSNLRNTPLPHIYEILTKAAMQAMKNAVKVNPHREELNRYPDAVAIGMSGYDHTDEGDKIRAFFKELDVENGVFNCKKLILVSSGAIALKAGTQKQYGVSLVIGTGTHCYGLAKDGKEATAGGWGYFLGDQGSGYWIGRALIRQVIREFDGRSPLTPITGKVLKKLGMETASSLLEWSYGRAHLPISDIAKLSLVANDIDLVGSYELNEIINESVRDVADSYRAVVRKLKLEDEDGLPVVIGGGLLSMSGNYELRVQQAMHVITPKAVISQLKRTPAQGAIRLIQESVGGEVLPGSALVLISPQSIND